MMAQEALHNIPKHAHATQVSVRLEHDGDELRLVVADNGRGSDPERVTDADRRAA